MSKCVKLIGKKYATRASPPYPAASCPVGHVKLGNNGKMYIVTANKNGVHRWVVKSQGNVNAVQGKQTNANAVQAKQTKLKQTNANAVQAKQTNSIWKLHVVIDEPIIKYYHVSATDWDSFVYRLPQAKLDSANQYTGYTQTDCRYFIQNNTLYFKVICIIELPTTDTKDKKVQSWLQHLHCHEMGHFKIIKKFIQDFFANIKLPANKRELSQMINTKVFSRLGQVHQKFDVDTKHGCGYDKNCSKISPCL
jgi:hypothetical protein